MNGAGFFGSTALTSVTIGGGAIGDSAFCGLSKLTALVLGDSVKSIGRKAFMNCKALTSVTVPNGVKSIGASAFQSCSTLTSVTIPKSVDSVGIAAFKSCVNLSFAAVDAGVIAGESWDSRGAFANTGITTLILGGNVKSIGVSAFSGCTKLTTLTIPDNVKSIGESAFDNCARLQSATIGNGVDTIGGGAFGGCSGLTSVIIGNKVKSIGYSAFGNCTGLASFTSLASDPPIVLVDRDNNTFKGVDVSSCKLKVQQVDMGMYRAASGWKDFAIEAVAFPNVPVVDITGVPANFKVGETLTLTGAVTPSNATNKAIEWSVAGASISGTNFTGAVIDGGNKLSASSPGTVVVRAAIANGAITGVDFERYFFITAEGATSARSFDRVVPSVKPATTAVVSPIGKLTAEFAAGPNPAVRLSGAVRFYWSGAAIKGATLSVYDASGNLVKKIFVNDNAVMGNGVRRSVGSWDLRDGKGRPVPAGTYLVKGAIKAKGGKRELVSAVVGVR